MERHAVYALIALLVLGSTVAAEGCNKGMSEKEIRRLVRDEVQEQLRERKRRQAPRPMAWKPGTGTSSTDPMATTSRDPKQRRVQRLRRRIQTLENLMARFSKGPGQSKGRVLILKKQLANMRDRLARAEGKAAAPEPTPPAGDLGAKPSLKDWQDGLKAGIRKMGSHRWEVDRRLLSAVMANPAQAEKDARVLPLVVGGKSRGFQLKEVRPKGIYAVLGFKTFDVIERVNNVAISDPSKVLDLFIKLKLKTTRLVTVVLMRVGQRLVHVYTIK